MLRFIFKTFFKVMLALGAVVAALAALRYFEEQQNDYIEIYNDDGMNEEYM
ncbi:hypothetical protein LJC04_03160 [Ruminococcaceae bacterium OttesenSCG-928-O06]|nr:hypothetical protein [Ruminococcaceae bacterium OttesenSCG-928-O06]